MRLLLAAGLRISSALSLDVTDLDQFTNSIALRSTKNSRPDVLPIPGEVMRELKEIAADRTAGPLFVSKKGNRLGRRDFARRLRALGKSVDVAKIHPHALRHSAAQNMLQLTGNVYAVKALLRHASLSSTAVYLSMTTNTLAGLVERAWSETRTAQAQLPQSKLGG